ncbi:MAG: type VII secretion protein EssC [Butyrivibrio sp.]|nr:type VII secretion protein EssC [Acetatifactor muris]MCM1558516.1 type VII secretion protein EssC [Butyrivibrio sp.]
MLVTLIGEQKIFSVRLPEKKAGKYWILDDERPMSSNRILAIEAGAGGDKWIVKADRQIKLYDEKQTETKCLALEEGKLYQLFPGQGTRMAFLLAEAFTEDRGFYKKYVAVQDVTLSIGRENDNDIVVSDSYVSAHHATLTFAGGTWALCDNQSTNGTYVNRRRVNGRVNLIPGDMVFILGFKFVVGSNFIAMNNPDGKVRIRTDSLSVFSRKEYVDDNTGAIPAMETEEPVYYYRSPRFLREITPLALQVDSPVRSENRENAPLLLTMGPSLIMGVASFSVGIFSIVNASRTGGSMLNTLPTMITSISMLLGMILFPVIMRRREKKQSLARETERREKYLKYLNNLRQEIQSNITVQEELLNENNPPVTALTAQGDFWERRLWGKSPAQSDFLYLRLGAGNMPLYGDIKFPEDRFSIEDDTLRDSLFAFQREERLLMNVPVGVSLPKCRVLGIVGDRPGVYNLLNNILMQILLLHSYDEVKLVCLYEKSDEKYLSFVKFAQHIWDNEGKKRFLALTEDNLRELSIEMNKIIAERRETAGADRGKEIFPHYVILCASKALSNKCAFLTDVLEDGDIGGFSVICAYDEEKSLPKECGAVVWVSGSQGLMYDAAAEGGNVNFAQDVIPAGYAQQMVQNMTDRQLDLNQGRYALPEMLSFMDMFGVGKYEHLNILQRWKDNNPVKTLQTPVGVDTNGETFYLDLHEKFHGPHGLVAGMTGSGKSEFIITYILSMAVNYHPDEVAFVLIDYKGGGLTGAFENEHYRLPHLAGTITNLDGGAIMRSILSIKSELRRRQAVFNHARDIANEGTMDIYKYQKMYRDGQVDEPLPHLFIISDEFAELKSQQPEFMEQLISTARIGRSLGVHLILATQKPSGVVNEQIWANSRFKVCLKVQDRADSNDMLKRPDAAEIAETGRFYLQVGYNELFEMGQSAWAGAAYTDNDSVGREQEPCIEVLDESGNVADRLKGRKTAPVQDKGRQIVRIMEYLDRLAKDEGIRERQLWMPEIPEDIRVDALMEKYSFRADGGLRAVIGELDDPYTQSQRLLDVNFAETGNVLIFGAAGSGKEMMLGAILYSLYRNYTPAELNAYILDFGAETLKMFESAPHTGSVMIDGESEKISGLVSMVEKEMKYRKKLFAEFGGDMSRYNVSGNDRVPYILVIVNNYSHFYESYERYEDTMISLTRECPKYGIYFILTATNTAAVRYRMLQNFRQMYVMQMNDKSDYASILGNTGGVVPPAVKGRGILKKDETYVFQTAHIVGEEEDLLSFIKQFAADLTQRSEGARARQISVLPRFVSGLDGANNMNSFEQLPLGISCSSCDYLKINAVEKNVLLIMSEQEGDALHYAGGLIETVSAVPDIRTIVFNGGGKLGELLDVAYEKADGDYENRIIELFNTAVLRNNNYKDTGGQPTVDMNPMLVVINGYEKLKENLSEDGKDKLMAILDKVEGFCNIYFVVCDGYRAVNRYYMDEWVGNRCGGEGVWVGDGIENQMRLTIAVRTKELRRGMDSQTGFYVSGGSAKLMRLVMPSKLKGVFEDEE